MTLHIWTGTPADIGLAFLYSALFGLFMGWGWRIAQRVP